MATPAEFQEELSVYGAGKGTMKFPLDQPIPFDLIRKIVTFRAQEHVERVKAKGGVPFIFVDDGIESAPAQAQAAAGAKAICVAGGAATAQQFLNAGLIDEVQIHLVSKFLGDGLRLFEHGAPMALERAHLSHL